MVRILNTLLEITVYSTAIFAVTMLVKTLLGKRLSPFLHYAIWSLFLLRLVLPVTFDSPVRVFTLPAPPAEAAVSASRPEDVQAAPIWGAAGNETAAMPQSAAPSPAAQTAPAPIGAFTERKNPSVSLPAVLVAVWLTGAGIGVGYVALLYVRLRKRVVRNAARPSKRLCALYREVRRELGIRANVPLVCQYGLTSPGILFPACVLMPMEALSAMHDTQVKNTLRHELMHFRRGDHIMSVLLSLLNAVYWFNPIVWIAVRRIRADMETRCDSAVVRSMNAEQKGDYAALILELFSRSRYRRAVLGMAYGRSQSVAERRIKGVFMNNTSKWGAKIVCLLLALVMGIGCFTTACVPKAGEESDVAAIGGVDGPKEIRATSGDAAASEPQAAVSPEPVSAPATQPVSPLAEKLGVPAHWDFEQQSADGELLVHGDIAVTLPDASAVPVATATLREVTEADLLRVAEAFFGPDVTFTYAAEDTKEYAEAYIEKNKALYESVLDGTCENKVPSFHKSVREQYEFYATLAQTAPSAAEHRMLEPVFTERIGVPGDPYMGFRGVATRDGTEYFVSASNDTSYSALGAIRIAEIPPGLDYVPGYMGTYRSEPEGVTVTKEQAIEAASAMAARIDDGLTLSHVMTAGHPVSFGEENPWEHPWAWQCIFMRAVNGVGTVYDSRDIGSDIESEVYGRRNEKLEITVDDRGVCGVRWVNPMTVESIRNSDATLLPFETITGKLADQLREKYDYNIARTTGEQTHELFIHHAELGLMRVGKPEGDTYTLEPVWSFFISFDDLPDYSAPESQRAAYDGDPVYWNSLTVSAIDGRVLDRDRGE